MNHCERQKGEKVGTFKDIPFSSCMLPHFVRFEWHGMFRKCFCGGRGHSILDDIILEYVPWLMYLAKYN